VHRTWSASRVIPLPLQLATRCSPHGKKQRGALLLKINLKESKTMTEAVQITKTLVDENKRLDFLPKYCGKHFMHYETAVYSLMDRASADYSGGLWQFYTLSNGGFFMALDQEGSLKMAWADNYYQGTMSAEAASIAVNLMALSHLSCQLPSEKLGEHFHQLREFALDHAEAGQIFAFID